MKKLSIISIILCSQIIGFRVYAQLTLVPPVPTDVTIVGVSPAAIRISFRDNCDFESFYHIEYSTSSSDGPFATDGIFAGGATLGEKVTLDFEMFEPNTTVHIKVSGVISNNDGTLSYGPSSPVISASTLDISSVPLPPSDFIATVVGKTIHLSWTDNSTEAGFYLIRKDEDSHDVFEHILSANTTSYIDATDIYKDISFVYYLKAINEFGYGGTMVSTSAFIPSTPSPPAPDLVTAIGVSTSHIRISFRDNSESETGYEIQFSDLLWNFDEKLAITIPPVPGVGNVTSHDVDTYMVGPSFGTTIYLQVRAYIDEGEAYPLQGPFSEPVSAATLLGHPATPSDFLATQEGNNIKLTWSDHSDDEGGFVIMRTNDGGVNFTIAFSVPANTTSFVDTTVVSNVTYTYILESVNEFGYGSEWLRTAATVYPIIPAPIARFASFVTSKSFIANWSAVETAHSYELYVVSINDSTVLSGYNGLIVSGTSKTVTGTKSSKRYAYYLKAVNAQQTSENSNIIRVASIKGLALHSVCSDNPAVFRRWKVINNNEVPVEISWHVNNTTQTAAHLASLGDSYFTTETVPGMNKATITWYNDKLMRLSSTKTSAGKSCKETSAIARTDVHDTDEHNPTLQLEAFPNAVNDKFQIKITAPTGKEIEIQIVNFSGRKMFIGKVIGNATLDIDASAYAPGPYILKANHLRQLKTFRLIKK